MRPVAKREPPAGVPHIASRLFRRKLGGDLPGHRFARQARTAAGLDQRAGEMLAGRRAGADDINVFHGYFDPATIIT